MDLRDVRYVVAVAEAGGITAAAAGLFISQPALSQAVRRVERELGVELFLRTGRRVRLTVAGEEFVDAARRVLRDMESLRAAVDAVVGLERGRLDLVSLPTLSVDPLVELVGAFRAAHPGVAVHIAEPEDLADIEHRVRDGSAEVALTEAVSYTDDLVVRPFGKQEFRAVLPPGWRLGRRGKATVTELGSLPLVATPAGTSTRRLLDAAFAAAGVVPEIAVETSHREPIVPLVLSGAGATFLPDAAARRARASGAVTVRLDPPLTRRLALVHRASPLSPAAAAFVDLATTRPHGHRV